MSKNVFNISNELMSNAYPGRGIIFGRTLDNKQNVVAYFIMGRSENSRNRIFAETEDGIRTEAYDPSKMTDPSLIPSFCGEGFYGLRVHEAALAKGVKVTGATVHFVSEVVDGGAIIAQKAVEVEDGDTPETLQKRVMQNAEWILLPQAVSDFCAGRLRVDGAIVHKN